MPDHEASTDTPSHTFPRSLFGYRREAVQAACAELEGQVVELRQALMERDETVEILKGDLKRAQAEIRYWNDRESYVESEVERARTAAERVEREAHERAMTVEKDAKDRALQMIDRVCGEANAILQHARDEAKDVTERFHDDARVAELRVEQLRQVQFDIQRAMRSAMDSFEDGMRTLEQAAPSVHALHLAPARELPIATLAAAKAAPDFGRTRAVEAARRLGEIPQVIPGLEQEDVAEHTAAIFDGARKQASGRDDAAATDGTATASDEAPAQVS